MRLLNKNNVDKEAFWNDYQKATSVFNGFYGILAQCANDALNEAADAYEGTPEYRYNVKRTFKRAQEAWGRLWMTVKDLFEEKYTVYVDFVNQAVGSMQGDMTHLYLAVHQSLLRQNVPDADRKAWVYAADLLTHQLQAIYVRFVGEIVKETGKPLLGDAFKWADPQHLSVIAHELVKSIATCDVLMDDNVALSVQIIAQKAVSGDRQDEAAIKALDLGGNEAWRESMAENIEKYHQHKAEKEMQAQEANDSYWREREKQRQRTRRGREETLTADAMAEKLGEKFNVKRK